MGENLRNFLQNYSLFTQNFYGNFNHTNLVQTNFGRAVFFLIHYKYTTMNWRDAYTYPHHARTHRTHARTHTLRNGVILTHTHTSIRRRCAVPWHDRRMHSPLRSQRAKDPKADKHLFRHWVTCAKDDGVEVQRLAGVSLLAIFLHKKIGKDFIEEIPKSWI